MRAPDFSADWYRAITGFAHGTPGWVHAFAEVGTDAGMLLFAALFVAGWWRARGLGARAMALALAAPAVVVGACLVSESAKGVLREERPCRAVAHAVTIAACPAPGDWSFPSNHSTIAAASAAAIVVAWRRWAPVVVPLALLMAFSRVFVGVHYPHDVAAGVLVGVVVAPLAGLAAARPAAAAVRAARGVPFGVLLLGAGPAPDLWGGSDPFAARVDGLAPVAGGRPPAHRAAVTMPDVMAGRGPVRSDHRQGRSPAGADPGTPPGPGGDGRVPGRHRRA
ncbi:phosphatase PAP2 family protein [Actinomadura parmotrematis]|uniref:Phosphatase PAP2 family protein n=1 Tax=Actinomadura parmotrematis TaxID=2864039 RepID=A0ABS7G4V6_9ACTN|nr:phosphatase PAP2 family protein [Actinomadura parmotrematis]MBW8487727.1 phosphatase PAP2 family protein [Actinomadura parmotrematis]